MLLFLGVMFVINLIFFVDIFLRMDSVALFQAEKLIGILSILELFLFLTFTRKYAGGLFSVSTLFILFLHLFNLGVPFVRLLGWIDTEHQLTLLRKVYIMGQSTYLGFTFYSFVLISMLEVGILLYQGSRSVKEPELSILDHKDKEYALQTGITLMGIAFLPFIYSEIATLRNVTTFGYQNEANTFTLSGTGIGLFAGLFTLGYLLVLVSVATKPRTFNVLFFSMIGYQLLRMFISGDRSTGIILILICIYIRHRIFSPIKGLRAAVYAFIMYAMLIVIKVIELIRPAGGPSLTTAYHEVIQNNLISATINDYGNNVWSGMMVFFSVPQTGHFRYGLTYLAALVGKPLSILKVTDSVWHFADFSNFLKEPGRGALINQLTDSMGGSFTGEWYFNFGWFGLLLIPIFGYALAYFSQCCDPRESKPILAGLNLYIATLVIWWVREYFPTVSWIAMVYALVVFLFYGFWKHRSKKKAVVN